MLHTFGLLLLEWKFIWDKVSDNSHELLPNCQHSYDVLYPEKHQKATKKARSQATSNEKPSILLYYYGIALVTLALPSICTFGRAKMLSATCLSANNACQQWIHAKARQRISYETTPSAARVFSLFNFSRFFASQFTPVCYDCLG